MTTPPKICSLVTVKQFCDRNPAFPIGGVRHHLFYRNENGLTASGAVIKLGRKILIDELAFINWVKSQGNVQHSREA